MRAYPKRGPLPLAVLGVAALASIGLPTALGAAAPAELAASTGYANGIDFWPNVDFSRATLTVSGNGRAFQQTFDAGDRFAIGLFDPAGQPLADGVYTWQLDLVPDARTARELRRAASLDGGGGPAAAWEAQSGSFAIRGGAIADPTLVEARQRFAEPRNGPDSGFTTTPSAISRGPAVDNDAAVGSLAGVEARINAAASSRDPAGGGDTASHDSDATTAVLGWTLERTAAPSTDQFSAQSFQAPGPRPRSDGSNGRPHS